MIRIAVSMCTTYGWYTWQMTFYRLPKVKPPKAAVRQQHVIECDCRKRLAVNDSALLGGGSPTCSDPELISIGIMMYLSQTRTC